MGPVAMRTRSTPKRAGALVALAVIGGLLAAPGALAAGSVEFAWVPGATYDSSIPTPDAFLGRPFGQRHITVDEIHRYCRVLAESSDRVELKDFGHSVEGDPLQLLVLADPAQPVRLEDRAAAMTAVRDPWTHSRSARQAAAAHLRPVTWIACSVHGDEASGADAGILLAYHLAASLDETVREILRKTVVLIDPCQNPDGRRRFLTHVRTFARQVPGPDDDPAAIEHTQLWPGGRRNHYLFDLNRDWAFLTQPETRARVSEFLKWNPQVFVDLHEMGRESSYFFPPPTDPVNPNVPEELQDWWNEFGRANARVFDAKGFDYFVREAFDLFFPGYGDSWPTLMGAIGMTYEQSTTRGHVLRDSTGEILHYRDAVLRHLTAALTTCETATAHADELIASYVRFFDTAKKRSESDPIKELLIPPHDRPAEAHRLAQVLVRQGIQVFRTTEPSEARVRPYAGGDVERRRFPPGTYRIVRGQPAYPLLRSLLDLETPMDEDFIRQELRRKERGLTDRFYDVTAWSLVLAYGVTAYTHGSILDVSSRSVRAEDPPREPTTLTASPATYAYLVPYAGNAGLRVLTRLLFDGVKVSVALDTFTQGERSYPRGTLVVKTRGNEEVTDLAPRLEAEAARCGAEVFLTESAWSDAGPSLGSRRVVPIEVPRIAIVSGPGVKPSSVGALGWVLEQRYGIPHSSILLETLEETDLFEFDTLILSELDGDPSLPVDLLEPWVRAGGTLVAVGSAAARLIREEGDWTTAALIEDLRDLEADGSQEKEPGSARSERPGDDPDDATVPPEFRPDRSPGAILRLQLEMTHFLTLGQAPQAYAPLFSDRLFRPAAAGTNVARYDSEAPRAAGFVWPAMEEAVAGQAYLIHDRLDRGHVILFAEDPCFRGAWEGLDRLLLNGVLLGPSLGR